MTLTTILTRFRREEDGAALVEFGLLLPTIALALAIAVEGGRLFLGYQTTLAGVRDATRYLSRVVQADACTAALDSSQWDAQLTQIVRTAQGGETLLPSGITVEGVTSVITCAPGHFRHGAAPVATVTANLRITMPFGGVLSLAGVNTDPFVTLVTDQTRIVGS